MGECGKMSGTQLDSQYPSSHRKLSHMEPRRGRGNGRRGTKLDRYLCTHMSIHIVCLFCLNNPLAWHTYVYIVEGRGRGFWGFV